MNKTEAAEKRYANLKYIWQQAEKEVASLKVQNADLVVALRFYADVAIIEDDGGKIARQALLALAKK